MRLVTRRVATYEEIMQYWNLNEVMEANEHLDIQDDAEWLAHKEAEAQMNKAGRR
jgi:hypothetical protein